MYIALHRDGSRPFDAILKIKINVNFFFVFSITRINYISLILVYSMFCLDIRLGCLFNPFPPYSLYEDSSCTYFDNFD